MEIRAPKKAELVTSISLEKIQTSKIYFIGTDSRTNEVLKNATELLKKEGITAFSKDTTGPQSADECGLVFCLLPFSETLQPEQGSEIFHLFKKKKMKLLIATMDDDIKYMYDYNEELEKILSNKHHVKDTESLVALIVEHVCTQGTIPSDTQNMFKIMIFFQESDQQAITTITVIVIVDSEKENEKVERWLQSSNYQRDGHKKIRRNRPDSTKLTVNISGANGTKIEWIPKDIEWAKVQGNCLDHHKFESITQKVQNINLGFVAEIQLEGADTESFKAPLNR